jgi:trehalose-6-phosphatase
MPVREPSISLDRFFQHVRQEQRRFVVLDYEGVLEPLLGDHDHAEDPSSMRALLNTILEERHTRIVVVSERPAREVPRLLHLTTPVEIFGSNGLEHLRPHGAYTSRELPQRAREGFAQARAWSAARGVADHLEEQLASVALHCEDLPPVAAAHLRDEAVEQWALIAWPTGLELRARGDRVALIAERFSKDRLVERLLDETVEGVAFAYLGDGPDDERAFRAMQGRGLGVLVAVEPRQTFASVLLKPGDETVQFLRRWHKQACVSAGREQQSR